MSHKVLGFLTDFFFFGCTQRADLPVPPAMEAES